MHVKGVTSLPPLALSLLLLACGGTAESAAHQRDGHVSHDDSDGSGETGAKEDEPSQVGDPDDDVSPTSEQTPVGEVPAPDEVPDGEEPPEAMPPEAMPPEAIPPEPMGTPPAMDPGPPEPLSCQPTATVSEAEIAHRLTQLLWDTDSAEGLSGLDTQDLETPSARAALARKMLEDPRAAAGRVRFVRRWLRLPEAAPNGVEPNVWQGIQESTDETIDWIVQNKEPGPLDFLQGADVVVTAEAAPFYRSEDPAAEIPQAGLQQFPERSVGLLTQTEWLMSYSNPSTRGSALLESLRCMPPPGKPSGVDAALPPGEPGETNREAYERHLGNPSCAGCHSFVDPPGFLFEHFDHQSYFRTQEYGKLVDPSGALTPEEPLSGAAELPKVLSGLGGARAITCAAVMTLQAISSGDSECMSEDTVRLGLGGTRLDAWLVQLVSTPSFIAE